MSRIATSEAVFADICSGLRNSVDVPPESAIAIRGDNVGLWVTAPFPSPDQCRRLLGLAAVVADASLLLYFADANVVVTDQTDFDEAFICIGIRLDDPDASEIRVRPYRIRRRGLRSGRTYGDELVLGSESAVFGPLVDDLRSSAELIGDSTARVAATRTLLQRGFQLDFDEWLDDELSALIG